MTRAQRGSALLVVLAAMASSGGARRTRRVRSSGDGAVDAGGASSRNDRGNPPFYDVLGRRYYVLPTSDGYRARGVASWYGRDFHGLATSSGETYNMNAMTAAHTTLPIPTWVEVTNLANGKHVVVKVNDRGPFVDNRLIDLSYAAALQLDMVRNGTARVEVRALGAAPAADPEPGDAAGHDRAGRVARARLEPRRSGRDRVDLVGRRGAAVARLGCGRASPRCSRKSAHSATGPMPRGSSSVCARTAS